MLAGSSARPADAQPAEAVVRIALGALLWGTVAIAGTACTTLGGDPVPVPQPAPGQPATGQWTVDSREHVDLWLHSFALLESDSNRVPYFRRGYRDSVLAARKRASVMVAGSPGMETGRSDKYDVIAFSKSGKTKVFASR